MKRFYGSVLAAALSFLVIGRSVCIPVYGNAGDWETGKGKTEGAEGKDAKDSPNPLWGQAEYRLMSVGARKNTGGGEKPPGGESEGEKPPGGETEGGQPPRGESEGEKPPGGKTEGGKPPGGETEGGKPPGGKTEGEKPPGGESKGEKPLGGESEGERPPGGESKGERPPGGESEGEKPPSGETEGERPPGGESEGEKPLGGETEGERPPGGETEGERPPGGESEGEKPPSGETEGEKPPGGETEGERPPGGETEGERPPGGESEGEKPPGGETEGERPPGGETEGEKPPGGETEGEKPPGGETEGEKPPGGEGEREPPPEGGGDSGFQEDGTLTQDREKEPDNGLPDLPPDEEEGCRTPEELLEQLETEGYAVLADDILLEKGTTLEIMMENDALVDMNGYSITVSREASLLVTGPVCFRGTVEEGRALFQISGASYLEEGVEIWAEGEGGIAVEVFNTSRGGMLGLRNTTIGASGDGCIALKETDIELILENVCIIAEGRNSTGIDTDGPVNLRFCRVISEGESIVTPDSVFIDISEVSPLPDRCEEAVREIYYFERLAESGISVEAGTGVADLLESLPLWARYTFYDPSGNQDLWRWELPVTWEELPEDLTEPGIYAAVMQGYGLPDWLSIEIPEVKVPVYVVDPSTPHIQEIFRMGETVIFRFFSSVEDVGNAELLCSSDGGDTWQDAASMPGCTISIEPGSATLDGLQINKHYLFCLSVRGGSMEGRSAVIPFAYYESDADRFEHGDRDGDDRGDQGDLLPGNSAPPPGEDFGNLEDFYQENRAPDGESEGSPHESASESEKSPPGKKDEEGDGRELWEKEIHAESAVPERRGETEEDIQKNTEGEPETYGTDGAKEGYVRGENGSNTPDSTVPDDSGKPALAYVTGHDSESRVCIRTGGNPLLLKNHGCGEETARSAAGAQEGQPASAYFPLLLWAGPAAVAGIAALSRYRRRRR